MFLWVFKYSIFVANITIHFHYFNLFSFYEKLLNIILLFLLYSLGENELIHSDKLSPFNMKLINPIETY